MAEVTMRYFENIFSSKGVGNLEYIRSGIEVCILDRMNQGLIEKYTKEEIIIALKSMGPTKAFRSDGFSTLFFQKYWHIVGQEVGDFYLDILNEGGPFDGVNMTNIVLIPKVASSTNLKNFCPINLCIPKVHLCQEDLLWIMFY
ncbi:reverse transcriptase [Gossypium australe]|uniref:Reverse transcriptase n=1 Tax=Gossypium australe TaxID=47621 RepID=A0A5B6VVE6_9ROSI|nr:reverse transcriptase [Gossypium australe]